MRTEVVMSIFGQLSDEARRAQLDIQRRRCIIEVRQRQVTADLTRLQEECAHPSVVKTPKSNTGNYDPTQDSYWYEFKCPDCTKFWREDQ